MAVSLRDQKKEQTREALFEAAIQLFRERGFTGTTVDDIAAAARVSRRTFFRYFPAKEAVVFPWDAERLDRFEQILRDRSSGEAPFELVRRAFLVLVEDYVA